MLLSGDNVTLSFIYDGTVAPTSVTIGGVATDSYTNATGSNAVCREYSATITVGTSKNVVVSVEAYGATLNYNLDIPLYKLTKVTEISFDAGTDYVIQLNATRNYLTYSGTTLVAADAVLDKSKLHRIESSGTGWKIKNTDNEKYAYCNTDSNNAALSWADTGAIFTMDMSGSNHRIYYTIGTQTYYWRITSGTTVGTGTGTTNRLWNIYKCEKVTE